MCHGSVSRAWFTECSAIARLAEPWHTVQSTSRPWQLDPLPAVQPKQWRPV